MNQAQVKIKEINVPNPQENTAHISNLRLVKKIGERDLNPIFQLLRLPKEAMLELEDELFKINLPCKVDQSLVDEFYKGIFSSFLLGGQFDRPPPCSFFSFLKKVLV